MDDNHAPSHNFNSFNLILKCQAYIMNKIIILNLSISSTSSELKESKAYNTIVFLPESIFKKKNQALILIFLSLIILIIFLEV